MQLFFNKCGRTESCSLVVDSISIPSLRSSVTIIWSVLIFPWKTIWLLKRRRTMTNLKIRKQPSRGVSRKSCSENMQQIYRRIPMSKYDFYTLWHGCSPVNLLHIFRTPFPESTSGWLLHKIDWRIFTMRRSHFHTQNNRVLLCLFWVIFPWRFCCVKLDLNYLVLSFFLYGMGSLETLTFT